MFGLNVLRATASLEHTPAARLSADPTTYDRRIALLRSGRRHGPVTRLITPWDIAELTQPFLFLAYLEVAPGWQPLLAVHPQPGVGALTLVLSGALAYRDALGIGKTLTAGGFRWTTASALDDGGRAAGGPLRALQLWITLPTAPAGAAENLYVASHELQEEGSVRVILGQFGRARGAIAHSAQGINYFHVRLRDGEQWRYLAPDQHNVTWLSVDRGGVRLRVGERVCCEQIALFGDSRGVIELTADGETSFVLGTASRVAHSMLDNSLIDAALTTLTAGQESGRSVERPQSSAVAEVYSK
jgi:redox-sensitive bicupin YhaK (pirin superfamily)